MDLDALAKELDACQACALRQDAIGPVGWFGTVSYTHLTLPTICSV